MREVVLAGFVAVAVIFVAFFALSSGWDEVDEERAEEPGEEH